MIKKYLSLVKFSHTIFAMPFAFIGFFLAVHETEISFYEKGWKLLIFIILEMIFARNAAMGFNRWSDRRIDALNPRTSQREIPSGKIKSKYVLIFVIFNALAFIFTAYLINPLVFLLSPVALAVVLGYSLTKHITWLCHLILGLGLALAPIGAYLVVAETFAIIPLLFSFIVLFWTAGFDIIYALQDENFDREHQLKSIPVLLGKRRALMLSVLLHGISVILMIAVGNVADNFLGLWYWIGAGLFSGAIVYQHLLVKPDDLSKVNLAFFTTNGIASLLLAVFTIIEINV